MALVIGAAILIGGGFHQIDEGHVGVYWRGGALLDAVTEPGYHTKLPIITTFANVQVTLQTDVVRNIPCGTSGGVMIYFDGIEVVNRLRKDHAHKTIKLYGVNYDKVWIFDKIHHEINQFCSKHTLQEVYIDMFDTLDEALATALQEQCDQWDTGVDIIAIRVTKPKIPDAVMHNYLQVTEEKTKLLVAMQHQQLVQKEEETKRMSAMVAAQRESEVAKVNADREATVAIIDQQRETNVSVIRLLKEVKEKENEAMKASIETQMQVDKAKMQAAAEAQVSVIRMETELKLKEAEARKASIDNQIYVDRQKAVADAAAYTIRVEAEANKLRLTPDYLRLALYQSLSNNTKIYFGPSIPSIFLDWATDNGQLTLKQQHD
eukprot:TRINITY_DN8603_c0_g1_i3.p1 TRINITY_DN8603_c0_g1~~TRINITY_DN8603_c0_g1_i3.p1  ORF type:complete len:407 (-),score=140.85 TRINITY_DN8603_c0_g1_i3:1188-2318(-)